MHPAHSSSEIFRYKGLKLIGVLNRPKGPEKKKFPGVLFLHGFPGAEKSVDVQRELLKKGVASFALSFSGAWGSEGEYLFSALPDQALAGLRFLASREFVDKKRLAVFGFSMGGWTALNMAAREPGLRAVAAVAPVGGPEMVTSRTYQRIAHGRKSLRSRSTGHLYRDFIRAMAVYNPHESVKRLNCPLLLVHGKADSTVPWEVSRRLFAEARQPKKFVSVPGARHDFLDRRERFSALVSGWFVGRLKS